MITLLYFLWNSIAVQVEFNDRTHLIRFAPANVITNLTEVG